MIAPSGVQYEYGGLYSLSNFDLTGRMAVFEIGQTPNYTYGAQAYVRLEADGNNALVFGFDAGNLFVQQVVAAISTNLDTRPWPGPVRGLRFYFDAGKVWFDYCLNGSTNLWWPVYSMATPIPITALRLIIGGGTYGTNWPGDCHWPQVNLPIINYHDLWFPSSAGMATIAATVTRKRSLEGIAVGTCPGGGNYAKLMQAVSPQNWWRLNEAGGTTVADQGFANKPGTLVGAATLGQPGALGDGTTALALNGGWVTAA